MQGATQISRRRFLLGAMGVGVAALSGAGYVATRQPPIDFATLSCGNTLSSRGRVLVAYSSRYGSTGEVAAAIGETLCGYGAQADVRRVTEVTDVTPYRAIIVGAPVISDEWMPEAVGFVDTHQDQLKSVPVAYFLTAMSLALDDNATTHAHMANVLATVQQQCPRLCLWSRGCLRARWIIARCRRLCRRCIRCFRKTPPRVIFAIGMLFGGGRRGWRRNSSVRRRLVRQGGEVREVIIHIRAHRNRACRHWPLLQAGDHLARRRGYGSAVQVRDSNQGDSGLIRTCGVVISLQ